LWALLLLLLLLSRFDRIRAQPTTAAAGGAAEGRGYAVCPLFQGLKQHVIQQHIQLLCEVQPRCCCHTHTPVEYQQTVTEVWQLGLVEQGVLGFTEGTSWELQGRSRLLLLLVCNGS
jgi:hypothetical protein